jgi:hypothetical protein
MLNGAEMIVRVSHIGHAVRSISEAESIYKRLFNISPICHRLIPESGVENAMVSF